MADIAVQPFVLKDVILKIDADNYQAALSSVRLTPSTDVPVLRFQGLTPSASFSENGSATTSWVFVINHAQDWQTANSLSQYLFTNAGAEKTIVLTPQKGAGKMFTFTATIVPGEIGGDVNTIAVSPVSMPVKGKPAMAAAPVSP